VSQEDLPTLRNPTRSKSDRGGGQHAVETDAWPEEAQIVSAMGCGFSYAEAFHMSPRDARRYVGIYAASRIPPDDMVGGTRVATASDVDQAFPLG
jgi:hypothetical protein